METRIDANQHEWVPPFIRVPQCLLAVGSASEKAIVQS